nr:prolipoprotein diacylglyceryl transferase [Maliibacterium massiliense]
MYPFLKIGSVTVPMYGLMIVTGVALGVGIAMLRARRTRVKAEDVLFCATYTGLGAFIGAKLLYWITVLPQIIENAGQIFSSWESVGALFSYGFVFYGGLIGGLIGMFIYLRQYKVPVWDMVDLLIPSVPLMHAIGRVGCFMVGCCYGRPMDPPWGLYFNNSPVAPHNVALFPIQLLEAGMNLVLFIGLMLYMRKARKAGRVLGVYLICYAVERFILEFFRYDAIRGFLLGVSTSQWISILLVPVGLFFYLYPFGRRTKRQKQAGSGTSAVSATEDAPAQQPSLQQGSQKEEAPPADAAKNTTP